MAGVKVRFMAAFSALLLAAVTAAGKTSDYIYETLTPATGCPSRPTSIVVEDFGFAWASSEYGLCRIGKDGVKTFSGLKGLPSDNIFSLKLDDEGNLWILTDNGICALKGTEGDVRMDFIPGIEPGAVAYSAVSTPNAVYFGGTGVLWKYVYSTGEFSVAARIPQDENFRIDNMCMSGIGRILLSCRGSDTAYSYFIKNGKVELTDAGQAPWSVDDYLCFVDSSYRLWVSSYNKGIAAYDLSGKLLRTWNTSNSGLSSNFVLCFMEKDGKIWAGTDGGGISIIDPSDGSVTVLKQDPDAPHSLPSNTIRTLACDSDGCVWAGRGTGGIILIKKPVIKSWPTEDIRPRISSDGITCLSAGTGNDPIWIGTRGSGLLSFDLATETFKSYPSTEGMSINAIACDGNDWLQLLCPSSGIYLFDKKSGTVLGGVQLNDVQKRMLFNEADMCADNDALGNIIFVTDRLYRFFTATRTMESFPLPESAEPGELQIVWNSGCTFFHDRKSIYRWDETLTSKLDKVFTIDGGDIRSACMGPAGEIWLAMDDKFTVCYDVATGSAHWTCILGSLPKRSIAVDAKGRVIMGTTGNLLIYTQNPKAVIYPDKLDGSIDDEYASHARCVSSDGHIFMGGPGGLVCMGPDIEFSVVRQPKAVVSDVKVDSRVIDDYSSLVVPHDFNDLFIRFFVRDRNVLRNAPCSFVLEGPKGSATFNSDLPQLAIHGQAPGSYRVLAKVRMRDGRWSELTEVFTFRVAAPWYRSWWFFAALGLAAIGLALAAAIVLKRRNRRNVEKLAGEERLDFLVNVSHELRTPLTLVMGPLARIIGEMPDHDPNKSRLSRIYVQADRMKTLLNTILTTNKMRAGVTSDIVKVPTDFAQWVSGQMDKYADEANGRNMAIVLQQSVSGVFSAIDDASCSIVFANIMMNALKHNEEGCPIMVKTELEKDGRSVRVSVTDRGPGFGDEAVENLFSRYYRADADRTGFGIGLAYAKDIVLRHDGDIGAYNNPDGAGATFWFELPVCDKASVLPQATERFKSRIHDRGTAPDADKSDLSSKTVLFVDDDPDLREYMKDEFSSTFGRTVTAGDGKEALNIVRAGGIDIVIADVMMSGMDGLTLCGTIKSDPDLNHIPVILLTARADEKSTRDGYSVHADAYIPKPFKPESLSDVAAKLV